MFMISALGDTEPCWGDIPERGHWPGKAWILMVTAFDGRGLTDDARLVETTYLIEGSREGKPGC